MKEGKGFFSLFLSTGPRLEGEAGFPVASPGCVFSAALRSAADIKSTEKEATQFSHYCRSFGPAGTYVQVHFLCSTETRRQASQQALSWADFCTTGT